MAISLKKALFIEVLLVLAIFFYLFTWNVVITTWSYFYLLIFIGALFGFTIWHFWPKDLLANRPMMFKASDYLFKHCRLEYGWENLDIEDHTSDVQGDDPLFGYIIRKSGHMQPNHGTYAIAVVGWVQDEKGNYGFQILRLVDDYSISGIMKLGALERNEYLWKATHKFSRGRLVKSATERDNPFTNLRRKIWGNTKSESNKINKVSKEKDLDTQIEEDD